MSLEPYRETITATRPTVTPSFAMGLTMFGRKVAMDGVYGREARPEDRKFANDVWPHVQKMMGDGLFWTHPVKSMKGGWEGVIEGVYTIRTQTMSGKKMVYSV